MASFIRLIDGTVGIADIENYDDEMIQLSNFVEFEAWPNESLEQRYKFKGMYFPFSPSTPIVVSIPSMHVLSVNHDVDDYLLVQYHRYVDQWFNAREDMKNPKKRRKKEKTEEDIRNLWDALSEMLDESANTTIH